MQNRIGLLKFRILIIIIIILLLIPSYGAVLNINSSKQIDKSKISDLNKRNDSRKVTNLNVINKQPENINEPIMPVDMETSRQFPKNHPMNDYSDVLVVVNDNSSISKKIGQYFKEQRNIPSRNMCIINTTTSETIDNYTFHGLRSQIEDYIENNNLTYKINYIVTTKGVPLRIDFPWSQWQRQASVDSELTLILERFSRYIDDDTNYQINNNYFYKSYWFSREGYYMYLVTRLTGYNFSQVKQLIDNAAASAGQHNAGGRFLFDRDPDKGNNHRGNTRLTTANNILSNKGYSTIHDNTRNFRTGIGNLAGYASWGGFDDRYLSTPMANTGFETDTGPADGVPDNWYFDISNASDHVEHNSTIKYTGQWSVNITRDFVNTSSYTAISQNVTVVQGRRYFLRGLLRRQGISSEGGAFLQIKAFDGSNNLVWIQNGTPVYGTTSSFGWLNRLAYDPISGVSKLTISAVLSKSSGKAFFDDIALYEVKPRHSYVPGAIADIYGYYTAWTFDYNNVDYRFYYNLNVGELIRDGITGISGYVDYCNPYIDTNAQAQILFDRYTSGYNLAESYYMASPYVSWVEVVIGDPKTSPYFDLLPDLTIEVENVTFSKTLPNQGQNIIIKALVENRGGSVANGFNVTFKVGNTLEKAKSIGSKTVANLPKGASLLIEMTWDTSKYNGTKTIWVISDSTEMFREQNETNNIASKQITINSYPEFNKIMVDNNLAYRGEIIEMTINITDLELQSNALACSFFVKQKNADDWISVDCNFVNDDFWIAEFFSNATTKTGWFEVKIQITDDNNATTEFLKSKVFKILNKPPQLSGLSISTNSLFRSGNLTFNFTAFDFEDHITAEMFKISIRHSKSGSKWISLLSPPSYNSKNDDWNGYFQSSIDNKVGTYDIRINLVDNDGDNTTIELANGFELLNNPPVIEKVSIDKKSIHRGGYAIISIFGNDIETEPENMVVIIEQQLSVESQPWSNESLTAVKWKPTSARWESTFYTNPESLLGNYSFRAKLIEGDLNSTEFLESDSKLEVKNNPPEAKIWTSVLITNEDDEILFDSSNSTDFEDFIISNYAWDFGDETASDEIKLHHSYSKAGKYNVTLEVKDKNLAFGSSSITIEIRNVQPIADFKFITSSANPKTGQTIEFDSSSTFDTKSDKATLNYTWDFGNGNTSYLPNPKYVYSSPGSYVIKLTVKDDDGATNSMTKGLLVEPGTTGVNGDGKEKSAKEPWYQSVNLIFIILIIIVIVILILFAILTKRRKEKTKDISEQTVETVEATIEDMPEREKIKPGTMVKPKSKKPAISEAKLKPELEQVTLKTAPPKTPVSYTETPGEPSLSKEPEIPTQTESEDMAKPIDVFLPETEIEFTPDIQAALPSTAEAPSEDIDAILESEQPEEELEIDVHLPESTTIPSEEIIIEAEPEVAEPETPEPEEIIEQDVEDLDFVPPKIDIASIVEPESKPVQPHRHEISEAKKRGTGLNLDFKKPEQKKKKKDL